MLASPTHTCGPKGTAALPAGNPAKRLCSTCHQYIGVEPYICTTENLTLHARCFVCSMCKRSLASENYGMDLNGKFYCEAHMNSVKPSEKDYKTLASGWLFKQGALVKKWRRRYFVLLVDSCELRYYKSTNTVQQQKKGVIDLSTVCTIQPAYLFVPADKNHPDFPSGSLPALQLVTPGRIWNLACETDSVREYWADAIRTAQATCGAASPAASSGVGRGTRGQSSHGQAISTSPSPPPIMSTPKAPRTPQGSYTVKTFVSSPRPVMSPPGPFAPETDDAETNSPDDDCAAAQVSRPRTGSGLARGDGSAQASQSVASNNVSNEGGGGIRRLISVQPIVVPPSSFTLTGGTPTIQNSSNFALPGSPNKRPSNVSSSNGLGSPVPWMPSTPRGAMGSGVSVAGSSTNGWDSSSTSSRESDLYLNESRLRAVSAGASFQPQVAHLVAGSTVVFMGSARQPQHVRNSSRPIIAQNRVVSPEKDTFLCSPSEKKIPSASTTPSNCLDGPDEFGVPFYIPPGNN